MTHGALDLLVTVVADEKDLVVIAGEPGGLAVHLGDERTGRVDRLEVAVGSTLHHGGRDAVSAEDDVSSLGNLLHLVDEDRALLLQRGHHVDVVHDLLAHVHRGTVTLERLLHGDHGTIHTRAVSPGRSEEHPLGSGDRGIL